MTPDSATTSTSTTPEGAISKSETKSVKPGYKTTEFWLTLAATAISMLYGAGVIAPDGTNAIAKSIALIAGVLATMGYAVARGSAKK